MANFFSNLWTKYKLGDLPTRLIYWNVAIFLVVKLVQVTLTLFTLPIELPLSYLEVSSNPIYLLYRPWTLITYQFLHFDLWHLLFNMMWLWWFSKLFLQFFSEKQFFSLFLMGGVAGALIFVAGYQIFPYFALEADSSFLLGASAAIMAIVVSTALYAPNFHIRLLFIGEIKLIYIAIVTVLIDAISIVGSNAGGHLAHIGGALLGILFIFCLRKGKDITSPLSRFISAIVTHKMPKRKVKMKAQKGRPMSDDEYNRKRKENIDEIDKILDKLKKSGYNALSSEEKKSLFDASKK